VKLESFPSFTSFDHTKNFWTESEPKEDVHAGQDNWGDHNDQDKTEENPWSQVPKGYQGEEIRRLGWCDDECLFQTGIVIIESAVRRPPIVYH